MSHFKTARTICFALFFALLFSMCSSGGSCMFRPDDDDDDNDDDDDSELTETCDEFCKNAFFCDLVSSEDQCHTICMSELSYAFVECGFEADVACDKFRVCFEEYGDEFSGDDDGGLECDYPAPSVEEVCDYPDISFYAGEMASGTCYSTCDSSEEYAYQVSFDDLCGYCFCCGFEDLF
jgi:hypothetical protein